MPDSINNAEFLRKHRETLDKLLEFAQGSDCDDQAFITSLTPRERAVLVQLADQLRLLGGMTLNSIVAYYTKHGFASDGEYAYLHPSKL